MAKPPPETNPETTTRCGLVALLGRPNVGKSSILNAMVGTKIAATTHKPQTTRRQFRGVETRGDVQLIFVDTPGLHERKGKLHDFMIDESLRAAADVDVNVFVIEAVRGGALVHPEDAAQLKTLAEAGALVATKPLILAINKIDVLEDKAELLPQLQAWASLATFASMVPLSAHRDDNVDQLFDAIGKLMPIAPFALGTDLMTDASERDIAGEFIREKVMLELGEELPYRTAVEIETFDESKRDDNRKSIVRIGAVIHVERDSQKAMVIGKGGVRIKEIGMRARKDIEHLLQCQVMLTLFVRVEPDWTQRDAGLRRMGYQRAALAKKGDG
jgi:GTPase